MQLAWLSWNGVETRSLCDHCVQFQFNYSTCRTGLRLVVGSSIGRSVESSEWESSETLDGQGGREASESISTAAISGKATKVPL